MHTWSSYLEQILLSAKLVQVQNLSLTWFHWNGWEKIMQPVVFIMFKTAWYWTFWNTAALNLMIILRKQNFLSICIQARHVMATGELVSQNALPRHASASPSVSATDETESAALSPELLELQLFQLLISVIHSKSEHGLIILLSSFWSFSFFYYLQFQKLRPSVIKHPTDTWKSPLVLGKG